MAKTNRPMPKSGFYFVSTLRVISTPLCNIVVFVELLPTLVRVVILRTI